MAHSRKGFFLNLRTYVLDLLHEAEMTDCKPARTPLDTNLKLEPHGDPFTNLSYYPENGWQTHLPYHYTS